jgi:TPP-dependent 2-oxoacid decarboxylase
MYCWQVISGGPNSNDFASNRVLHHTTGIAADLDQQMRAFQEVTCCQVRAGAGQVVCLAAGGAQRSAGA